MDGSVDVGGVKVELDEGGDVGCNVDKADVEL